MRNFAIGNVRSDQNKNNPLGGASPMDSKSLASTQKIQPQRARRQYGNQLTAKTSG